VGRQHDGGAEVAERFDEVPRSAARLRIEAGGGFVEEDDLGTADERECEVESAQLAPGTCRWRVGLSQEADELGQPRPSRER
jgi:hypothetical protein